MAEAQLLLPGVCWSIWQYDNEFDNYNNGEDEDGDKDDEDEVVCTINAINKGDSVNDNNVNNDIGGTHLWT